VSGGGFLRTSRAASASANWRFNFSIAFRETISILFLAVYCAHNQQLNTDESNLLTGLGRSASKNTTRNTRSTVTWSFCSSNYRKQGQFWFKLVYPLDIKNCRNCYCHEKLNNLSYKWR
jgi:hypothetical protein